MLSAEAGAAAAETRVRLKDISVAANKIHAGLLGSSDPKFVCIYWELDKDHGNFSVCRVVFKTVSKDGCEK